MNRVPAPPRPPGLIAAVALLSLTTCEIDRSNLTDLDRNGGMQPAVPDDAATPDLPAADSAVATDAILAGDLPPAMDVAPSPEPPPPAPLPVACEVSAWGPWSMCSRPCGGGQQARMRTVLRAPANGGAACPALVEMQECNLQGCPVDCQVGDWSDWSTCSKACGGGTQSRSRPVTRPAANGGAPCPMLLEQRTCNPAPPNACGGCVELREQPGQTCGRCGKVTCDGGERTTCNDPGRSCQAIGATCGSPPDGCGGQLACGACADALTSCGAGFTCACGKPTALYSPTGFLEPGQRASSPDGQWYATAEGVFTAGGQLVAPLGAAKAFDWHPRVTGRFAVMHHFAPPALRAAIVVHQIGGDGQPVPTARAAVDSWFHAMAWADDQQLALGTPAGCTTAVTVTPSP